MEEDKAASKNFENSPDGRIKGPQLGFEPPRLGSKSESKPIGVGESSLTQISKEPIPDNLGETPGSEPNDPELQREYRGSELAVEVKNRGQEPVPPTNRIESPQPIKLRQWDTEWSTRMKF